MSNRVITDVEVISRRTLGAYNTESMPLQLVHILITPLSGNN